MVNADRIKVVRPTGYSNSVIEHENGGDCFAPISWELFPPISWGLFQAVKWGLFMRNFYLNSSNYIYVPTLLEPLYIQGEFIYTTHKAYITTAF